MSESKGKSLVVKRAISIRGRNSSVSLEEPFWSGLKEIAAERGVPLNELVAQINEARETFNLSSAIRQFVLAYYQQGADESL
jgi:predicted DNA-binding ribbon-helix-helix protein